MTQTRDLIIEVMREVQGVAKREKNTAPNGGYNFRGIDAVVNAIGPALRKHGGFIVPRLVEQTISTATTSKGSLMNVVRVQVEFTIYGSEGDPVSGSVAAEAFDSGDKATAKAMSVAYRTFLLQTFCLPTDEPDPDSFSYEAAGRNFLAEAEEKKTKAELRTLYMEANRAKADPAVLTAIKTRADGVAD